MNIASASLYNSEVSILTFWKQELKELSQTEKTFKNAYRIMKSHFSDEIFGERSLNGRMERITYSQFYKNVDGAAYAISNMFADKRGGFIGIRMDNSPEWVACFYGCLKAGFKPLLLNIRLDSASLEYTVKSVNAVAVISDEANFCDGDVLYSSLDKNGVIGDDYWENEIALMTSGTTGQPKIIVYNGEAICAQILLSGDIVQQNRAILHNRKLEIKLVAFLPFYHIFGLMAILLWFVYFGRTLIFLNGYDSESIRFACKYHKATHFFAVPLVWNTVASAVFTEAKKTNQLGKLNKAVKISNKLQNVFPRFGGFVARNVLFKSVREKALGTSLKFCISGGGFLRDDALELLNGLGYTMHVGYGMTEAGICSVDMSRRAGKLLDNTVGKPFPTVEQVVSNDGMLYIKGKTLYTAEYKDGVRIERDGSEAFCTNDMFEVLPDGRWNILGRKDDIIIGASGENISPDAIEQLISLPVPYCVIGQKLSDGTEKPVLIVSTDEKHSEYEKLSILNRVYSSLDRIPVTMRPAAVYTIAAEIPTTLGKPRRNILKEQIANGSVELIPAQKPDPEILEKSYDETTRNICAEVRRIFSEVLKTDIDTVTDTTHFIYDCGGDSMTYYNLIAVISEKFGVTLTFDADSPLMTPMDITMRIISLKSDNE